MSSLLPLLHDLLPMIIPSSVHITRASDLEPRPRAPPPAPSQEQPESEPVREATEATSTAALVASTPEATAPDASNPEPPAPEASPAASPEVSNRASGSLAGGFSSTDAILGKTDKMCAAVLRASPASSSPVYHNAEQDAIIYAASGSGILATLPEDDDAEPKRYELSPGDFAFVPCWTEHQVLNSSDQELVWIVIRSGPYPTIVNLTEWGGSEADTTK